MLNMDFDKGVTLDTRAMDWVQSPHAGVWRKPLAREEAERGHATSIVRYDPGASFHGHNHPGGEEILVLEGTFSDETGDFRAGTYFRNPAGFRHAPFSEQGCVILVKLHQFQPDDDARLAIETSKKTWHERPGGRRELPLHRHGTEEVRLVELLRGAALEGDFEGGLELYVIDGALREDDDMYEAGTWLRRPAGRRRFEAVDTTRVWLKSGHLP